jgi:ribulose-5-phosphate 4-epimerase/fuculose-1-phosphate aldolase
MAFQQALNKSRPVNDPTVNDSAAGDAERQARVDLAAAYRLAALNEWDDVIYTHISMRVPGADAHFLINPFGMAFEEITASSLVKIDHDAEIIGASAYPVNSAGFVIHSAVHRARPEVNCVMHLHTEAGMALSMMKCGLLPLSQHAMMFYNRIGYHPYEGIALDMDEQARLIADLGPHSAMILHNHGLLTAGRSVAEAYLRMFYLEKAARAQMMAMAATDDIVQPPPEVCELTASQHAGTNDLAVGAREWPATLRRLDRIDPSYRE